MGNSFVNWWSPTAVKTLIFVEAPSMMICVLIAAITVDLANNIFSLLWTLAIRASQLGADFSTSLFCPRTTSRWFPLICRSNSRSWLLTRPTLGGCSRASRLLASCSRMEESISWRFRSPQRSSVQSERRASCEFRLRLLSKLRGRRLSSYRRIS